MFKSGDYKAKFIAEVDRMLDDEELRASREQRLAAIEQITEQYLRDTGERPDPKQLDRLADFCLREELTDRNPYKMTHDEFPIMSQHQIALRRDRSAPMIAAATVGSDKADHRKPIRRNMSTKRMIWLDEKTRIQNKERRERYKRDTAPGEIIQYTMKNVQTV